MNHYVRRILAIGVVGCLPLTAIFAEEPDDKSPAKVSRSQAVGIAAEKSAAHEIPEISLLDAARTGAVTVIAEGRDDGRMTVTVTNRTRRRSALSFPPASSPKAQPARWVAWVEWAAEWVAAAWAEEWAAAWAAEWAVEWVVEWAAAAWVAWEAWAAHPVRCPPRWA